MLGFTAAAFQPPPIPISIPSISTRLPILPLITTNRRLPSSSPKFQLFQKNSRKPRKFVVSAENRNGPSTDPKEETEKKGDEEGNGGGGDNGGGSGGEKGGGSGGEDYVKRNGRPMFNLNLRWADLLLDPDPVNVVAVGLTGVLPWGSLRVLRLLYLITLGFAQLIVVEAVKYSFIAAFLLFIGITLL